MRRIFPSVTLFELDATLGGRPTVGPQTLNLLIGVRIPASQLLKEKAVNKKGRHLAAFFVGVYHVTTPRPSDANLRR